MLKFIRFLSVVYSFHSCGTNSFLLMVCLSIIKQKSVSKNESDNFIIEIER